MKNRLRFLTHMPYEITLLSNMISLDLSGNEMSLHLLYSTTTKLAQNMTRLEELHLDYVDLSSPLPKSIANLSSLISLSLSGCNLYGEFLQNIFHLPKIQAIDVSFNNNISGFLPINFRSDSKLKLPSSVKNLSRLSFLDLGSNNFNGQLPSALFELPSLQYLDLGFNQYRGPLTIPNVLFSSQLTNLYLYSNKLTQKIPRSIFEMKKGDELNLSENDLSGTIEMSMFSKLSQLRALYLSDNNLSVVRNTITNFTLIFKMNYLGLASCNITEFPKFLKTQIELKLLDLSNNKIEGKIPKWFFCIGVETLDSLDMSANFITGWEQELKVLPWKVLQTLDLSHSRFRVTFLFLCCVPTNFMVQYGIQRNYFTNWSAINTITPSGDKSRSMNMDEDEVSYYQESIFKICIRSDLIMIGYPILLDRLGLDRSVGIGSDDFLHTLNFQGEIPKSLGDLRSLIALNLSSNNFEGYIPLSVENLKLLESLDLSKNKLFGRIPQELATLTFLAYLNLSNNNLLG
ncbi:hypothetical protein G4B88_016555 [Cannabis sativa]|uniref:Uncharacterized protein n=1 Tax=Cannabis sativa TaxID=3483 RepID=A0A7J6H809_CANSA|nr:hypothetical protein G4B88_016555 [Cannabis sativa]